MIVPDLQRQLERVTAHLPWQVRNKVDAWMEHTAVLFSVQNPVVMGRMLPSAVRGLYLRGGRDGRPTLMRSGHETFFDWTYPEDQPRMAALYEKAKRLQWNASTDIDWSIDVDPLNPEKPVLPADFLAWDALEEVGIRLDDNERREVLADTCRWMLSQFLHGEQGALFASAQVTESVPLMDGKFYGATQVMDEARHVEVFHRYLDTKCDGVYVINDNLFTIIDSLMTDSRWDMKFLGMQIMVEGLALGAFSTLYKVTREPLLREVLRRVIHDEARHVHYGVLALREHFTTHLSERERREREDWAFEIALLMRNRFLAHEMYEERFGHLMTRRQWNTVVHRSPGLRTFRKVMFTRLVPNLREIGLLTDRILPHYERAGLGQYVGGRSAMDLSADEMLAEQAAAVPA